MSSRLLLKLGSLVVLLHREIEAGAEPQQFVLPV